METDHTDVAVIPRMLVTSDGRLLEADVYRPRTRRVRAQVVLHGATAVPRKHYAAFARHMAEAGFEILIYDYRGVGGSVSDHVKHDDATMSDWLERDAPAAVRALRGEGPSSVPFFAIGHSFGGQIVAALEGVPQPEAVVTMGAQRGYWAAFAPSVRPRMWLNWFVLMPMLTTTLGYLPGWAGLGVDMPAGVVDEWASWCKRPDYYLSDHPEIATRLASYRGKLLALSVTDDDFAPLGNVSWLIARHRRAALEHVRFRPEDVAVSRFGHFGFFRVQYAASVWPEVVGHFEEVLGEGVRPRRLGAEVVPASDGMVALDDDELALDLDYGRV
ncbi:MAG: alpha/beta fold hydrolase [Polyangiales bacterium]